MVPKFITGDLSRIVLVVMIALGSLSGGAWAQSPAGEEALQRFDEAVRMLQEAAARQDVDALESLQAEVSASLATAESAFFEAYEQHGDVGDALGYIKVLRLKGDDDLAAEFAASALDRGLENALLLREYGSSLLAMGPKHFQKGVQILYRSLELDSGSSDAVETWNVLGNFYVNSLMPAAAAEAFDAALAIDGGNVRAQLGRLVVEVFEGDIASAGGRLTSLGREAQPYDTILRRQLRLALDDYGTHRRYFRDTAENHYAFGRLSYAAARFPEAMQALNRAVRLNPDDPAMWNFLASFQGQMGDYPGAVRSFEASLRANPDQPNVRRNLELLRESMSAQESAEPLQGQGPLR